MHGASYRGDKNLSWTLYYFFLMIYWNLTFSIRIAFLFQADNFIMSTTSLENHNFLFANVMLNYGKKNLLDKLTPYFFNHPMEHGNPTHHLIFAFKFACATVLFLTICDIAFSRNKTDRYTTGHLQQRGLISCLDP